MTTKDSERDAAAGVHEMSETRLIRADNAAKEVPKCKEHGSALTEFECSKCRGDGEYENEDYDDPLDFGPRYYRCHCCGGTGYYLDCEECFYDNDEI